MTDLRIGVVGTGMMGCEHITNLASVPRAVVTAVSDPNEEPMGWARLALGDRAGSVREFSDHRDMLGSGAVDAVLVASPNNTHRSVLDDVFAADLPVLVEKPMCTTVEDCLAVVDAQSRRRALTWVGLEYRYMPPVAEMLRRLRSGGVGELRMFSVREHRFPFLKKVGNWNRFSRNTGGTLVEKCCHFFDLMNLAVGARPVRVMASGGQDVNHLDEWYDGERSDILDNAFVIVDYANGVRAMLDLSMFAEGGRWEQHIVAVGSAAKLEAEVPGDVLWLGDRAGRSVTELDVPPVEDVGHIGFHHGASWVECRRFVDAVLDGAAPEVGVSDGLWSVVVGAAAHRSIDEGRVVSVSEWGL
ncbi:MAG: scyllo-inositol 2-dehydrogenase [Actinomycetota bacterium]|jgi:predicted dehydrogenase